MPKSKAIMNSSSNVEMNTNSSSEAKKTINRTVSSVIKHSKTSNTKKKATLAIISNEKSSLNDNVELTESNDVEIDTGGTVSVKNKKINELAGDINSFELSLTVDIDELPGEIADIIPGEITNKPPKEITNEPPGATAIKSHCYKYENAAIL
ncbi:8230_t:CDS:2 [Scutellospora calospora]|uniref:8230_t:CDS:1 n=1 Tax=Scutellospora calospora TaxID=85575 RepID=A0ACA9JVH6_9GLOM|nr:8230_t:CDS:2 [Scutellospora calospora]